MWCDIEISIIRFQKGKILIGPFPYCAFNDFGIIEVRRETCLTGIQNSEFTIRFCAIIYFQNDARSDLKS